MFQVLITFLALNGKVIVSSPTDMLISTQGLPEQIVAKLAENNEWTFHNAPQNHTATWTFLSETFNENYKDGIPAFFVEFLKYIAELDDLPLDLTDQQAVRKVVISVPRLRHQALYAGFGFDRTEFERAIKRQTSYDSQIDALSKAFRVFVIKFLSHCLKETLYLKENIEAIENFPSRRFVLRHSIWSPPFESTKDLNLGENDISNNIKILQKWLGI